MARHSKDTGWIGNRKEQNVQGATNRQVKRNCKVKRDAKDMKIEAGMESRRHLMSSRDTGGCSWKEADYPGGGRRRGYSQIHP